MAELTNCLGGGCLGYCEHVSQCLPWHMSSSRCQLDLAGAGSATSPQAGTLNCFLPPARLLWSDPSYFDFPYIHSLSELHMFVIEAIFIGRGLIGGSRLRDLFNM